MTNTPEIEVVKKVYAAINQDDTPAALKLFDPQIVRVEFEGLPSAGFYRGLSEVGAHFSQARSTWAEGSCTPERFITKGDKVIAFVYVRVRLKNQSEWLEGHTADVFTFRNGKIIEMRTFAEADQALKWAGVKA